MRHFKALCRMAVFLAAVAICPRAAAQDEEYFNNAWWSCELSGHQTEWFIKSYRTGISFINGTDMASGTITFSDDCIEFNHPAIQMHFPVAAYKRISDNIFAITRNGEDDYFDYIEVIREPGKKTYRLLLAKRDPDDTMQNTRIFICKPHVYTEGRTAAEARAAQPKGDGIPPQVPKK